MNDQMKSKRSGLPKPEARKYYVERGQLAVLRQIKEDAAALDENRAAVGPFARLDANAVAAGEGKTRGAVTNVFGSQAAFQSETMMLALSAGSWIENIEYPPLADFKAAEDWVDAFLLGQAERGPQHESEPNVSYASFWALWLSAVPYGLWSKQVSRASMAENVLWIRQLEMLFGAALGHFGLKLRNGTTLNDLASAVAGLIEGIWLNQCLSSSHPSNSAQPISSLMRRSGILVWRGAVES